MRRAVEGSFSVLITALEAHGHLSLDDLMAALRVHIEKKGWTQSEAAKKLGITQPRISSLMKGAWRDFSADMLLVLATRMGLRPTLKLAA
jgi:predicted XRE-type DNA-binding protein